LSSLSSLSVNLPSIVVSLQIAGNGDKLAWQRTASGGCGGAGGAGGGTPTAKIASQDMAILCHKDWQKWLCYDAVSMIFPSRFWR